MNARGSSRHRAAALKTDGRRLGPVAGEAGAEMAGMMMTATTADQAAPSAPDPCCDHGKKTMDGKACAQACATMCGISAALPTANVYVAPRPKASVVAERVWPLKPRPPPRTERPPRSIA
jgi:hypothetical protein